MLHNEADGELKYEMKKNTKSRYHSKLSQDNTDSDNEFADDIMGDEPVNPREPNTHV